MQKLVQGVHQFQKHYFSSQRELFERLAKGQEPDALFITCSDSRISPDLITQSAPGDLFILRNAGNIVPPYGTSDAAASATIEFSVAGLRVKDIIICGHSHCGAMRGMLHPEMLADMPAMTSWLGNAEATRRIIKENYQGLDEAALLTAAVEENVLVQLENLRTHPVVAARLSKGELHLHAWVYKIETGQMFSYDATQGQYVPLAEAAVSMTPSRNLSVRSI